MERLNNAHIKPGKQYDKLFPRPNWKDSIIKRSADLSDTLELLPKVVNQTKGDTAKISKQLKGKTKRETCRNIWYFVYDHIPYRRDEKGKEQIRRPSRSWFERKHRMDGSPGGVDCDCYTVFISSVLTNLDIDHTLRVTKNNKEYFQHIYPIVPDDDKYITLDCVVDTFDYEAPFKEKIDKPIKIMELHYLSGLESHALADDEILDEPFVDHESDLLDFTLTGANIDAQDFIEGLSEKELGFLRKLRKKVGRGIKKFGKKVGEVAKKTLHVVNKINPATLLLRNGVLLAMKLNMMKVAERLKYAYLSETDARKRGIDINKHRRLVSAKNRLEKIFYGAGGRASNLKKAILSGKGNKNREVRGLGSLGKVFDGGNYDENSSIREILGEELYYEEFAGDFQDLEGFEGLAGELGEIATGTALAAASGAVAAISKLLDKIGDVKGKASSLVQNTPFAPKKQTAPAIRPAVVSTPSISTTSNKTSSRTTLPGLIPSSRVRQPTVIRQFTPLVRTTSEPRPAASNPIIRQAKPQATSNRLQDDTDMETNTPETSPLQKEKGFADWVKKNPVKAGVVGVGIIAVGFGVYLLAKPKKTKKSTGGGLSGTANKKRKTLTKGKRTGAGKTRNTKRAANQRKTTKRRTHGKSTQKKVAIALM